MYRKSPNVFSNIFLSVMVARIFVPNVSKHGRFENPFLELSSFLKNMYLPKYYVPRVFIFHRDTHVLISAQGADRAGPYVFDKLPSF